MIFVLSGPSGVGKSFLCKDAVKHLDDFYLPKKHTSRNRRIGEDDFEYFFIRESEFNKMVELNEFVVHTNIYNNLYGLSKKEIELAGKGGKHAIFILDAFLAPTFKSYCPEANIIFILPTDVRELVQHLKMREALYNEKVDKRIELLEIELEQHKKFDFVIPHFNGETTFDLLRSIIASKFCQRNYYSAHLNSSIRSFFKIYPKLAVDAVVFNKEKDQILLIERLKDPKGWALPGGFVENRETVEAALIRETREETGIDLYSYEKIGVFSQPDRDPRLHVVSIAFIAFSNRTPLAGSDAKSVKWFFVSQLPDNIVFDHRDIISLAMKTCRK